ncbi:MAG: hypothetical protein JKY56_11000 [Kofleriaceae bacterium]|nr:hypothetical protein [Kofleriaceae bacterium]
MNGQSSVLVSWGEFLWDMFPSGACLGGAPANVALHLVKSGHATALITRLGRDELGDKATFALTQAGLHPAGLQVDEQLPTGKVDITLVRGEPSYTLHPGAWREIQCDDAAVKLLGQARAFCYGSLSQESETGLTSFRRALRALPDNAVRFFDPNLRGGRIAPALVRELLAAADIVKINDDEAQVLERCYKCDNATIWLLEELQVKLVAQTHGASGATLTTANEEVHHAGFAAGNGSEDGGDSVGAGDAFTSILIRAALANTSLTDTIVAANLYASFVAGQRGATPIPPGSLLREIREQLGEELGKDTQPSG